MPLLGHQCVSVMVDRSYCTRPSSIIIWIELKFLSVLCYFIFHHSFYSLFYFPCFLFIYSDEYRDFCPSFHFPHFNFSYFTCLTFHFLPFLYFPFSFNLSPRFSIVPFPLLLSLLSLCLFYPFHFLYFHFLNVITFPISQIFLVLFAFIALCVFSSLSCSPLANYYLLKKENLIISH